MFETIISKLTTAARALASFISTSPWFVPVAAILALFLVVAP
jgi:hypothetical protein